MNHPILSSFCYALASLLAPFANPQMPASPSPAAARTTCAIKPSPASDAEAALSREDYPQALDLYRKMADAHPEESRAGVIRTLLGQDNLKDAEDLAHTWVKLEPKSAAAAETFGEVLFRKGEMVDAVKTNQAARTLNVCNARVYLMQAALSDLLANFKTAKGLIEMAHRLAPQDVEIRDAWIGTLPYKRRLEERSSLLKEDRLLGPEERTTYSKFSPTPLTTAKTIAAWLRP